MLKMSESACLSYSWLGVGVGKADGEGTEGYNGKGEDTGMTGEGRGGVEGSPENGECS